MAWYTVLDKTIQDYLPDLKWVADEPMAKHTSFRIGGPAKRMAFPENNYRTHLRPRPPCG